MASLFQDIGASLKSLGLDVLKATTTAATQALANTVTASLNKSLGLAQTTVYSPLPVGSAPAPGAGVPAPAAAPPKSGGAPAKEPDGIGGVALAAIALVVVVLAWK